MSATFSTNTGRTFSLPRRSAPRKCRPGVHGCCSRINAYDRRSTALLDEIIAGINLYFDKALGNNLLYRFERAQYVEQKRSAGDRPMSEIYGAEHLLRLFGEFNRRSILTDDSQLWTFHCLHQYRYRVSQHFARVYQRHYEVSGLVFFRRVLTTRWMIKEQKRLFVKEYETTTTQYQNLSRT